MIWIDRFASLLLLYKIIDLDGFCVSLNKSTNEA